ncbi:hypothetical protein QR680_012587 [Steinernema hermaphroditum]|uniref:PDZ domain-containing protein n=1 Tax=Steinernema hermaphroditum TaxID=289476 RepID=A0AA39I518_9BILA|nr:hypothetical protein QR680_012587 [Steinernema hermaphroditum]
METGGGVKVFYYLNDGDVPYVSVVPPATAETSPTLGDFKKVFARNGFRYYCKELDADIGREVKVELTDERAPLKAGARGLVELFLVQQQPFASGTLPRAGKQQKQETSFETGRLKKRRSLYGLSSVDGAEIGGGQRVSMVTNEESSQGTVLSRRAGEHLADMYATNSEDPYNVDDRSASSFSAASSAYGGVPVGNGRLPQSRHRRPRKERYRKAYVPSTISSAAESSLTSQSLPRIDVIKISMKSAVSLGIKVVGHDGGIFVSLILSDGAAAQDGRLEVGDQIVQINDESFESLNDQQAVSILKKVSRSKRSVTMYVSKRPRPLDESSSDVLSGLAANETMPLNISSWVKSTMHRKVEPHVPFETLGESTLDPSESMTIAEETSDEEHAAYLDRRSGVGARFVPALGMRNQIAEDVFMRQKENDENDVLVDVLSASMDPRLILRAMTKPDSGLQIKNRKWLKILVPMSFIGSGLVDWLLTHVQGIGDRKAAREYASKLLADGLIRHVVNKMTFTEKCYYVFDDSVLHTATRSAGAAHSSGTEVTYVASPAPQNEKEPSRPPLDATVQNANATWPISPITMYGSHPAARQCESPTATNEYASMIGTEFVHLPPQPRPQISSEAPTLKVGGSQTPSTRSPFFAPLHQRSMSPPPNTPNTFLSSSSAAHLIVGGASGPRQPHL